MIPFPEGVQTVGPIPGSDSSRNHPKSALPRATEGKTQREVEEKGSISFSS